MASPDKYSPSVEQKDCPPELKVKLKWKKNEWQDRAKSFNTKSFEEHKSEISDVKKAADTFMAQSVLENITLNADDKALLKYMRTLSVDKPIDISIMQTMLHDVCDKTIAVDGRMGEQTITAMKLAMEKFKSKIPGYQEWLVVGAKIDAAIAPVIDIPSVKIPAKPAQVSGDSLSATENDFSISIQEKVNSCKTLLKANYPGLWVQINEKWDLFIRQDVIGSSDTKLQKIATIDLSKTEDIAWDNIRVALEEYIAKQKVSAPAVISTQTEAISTDKQTVTNESNQIDVKAEQTKKIQLSPEQDSDDNLKTIEADWNKVMNQAEEYARKQWLILTMVKTGAVVKSMGASKFNPIEIYDIYVKKEGQTKAEKIGTSHPVHLERKVDIQGKVKDIQVLVDKYLKHDAVKPQEVSQEAVDKAWYEGFDEASNYAKDKWYILTNQASELTAKGWNASRPNIDKGKLQTIALVNKNKKERRELWTISVEKIHLVSIKTPQEIRDEIQKRIDESLARTMTESQENKTRTENITKIDTLLQKMWYSLDYVDGKAGRMYKNQNNERLQVFWWFSWVPKDHTLTDSEIRYNLLQNNKQKDLQQQIDNAMNGKINSEANEQHSEKIFISKKALSEFKTLGITLTKQDDGIHGDFDQNKHFMGLNTSFDKSGKFIKTEEWPVSKKVWEEFFIDNKTKSVTFENGVFTFIDKDGSKMTSVLTEVKNQPMDQEMINNFKNDAPNSVQVLSATDLEIKLKTIAPSVKTRSFNIKSAVTTWFDEVLWEITFNATKEDSFTKMLWKDERISGSIIAQLASRGFVLDNWIQPVADIESRSWDNVMVIPHPDGKGFATVCKGGGVHVYNKDNINPSTVFARKPVIYLYPIKKTKISVSVELSGADMITEYPRTTNGIWKVEASPKGNLVDIYDKKKYSYLFWEAAKHTSFTLNPENTDCIANVDVQTYLEKSLKTLGLNAREMNDFMVYWLPILEQNPYSLIEWKTTEYTDMAKLHISPKPETLIRIFMVFKWSEQIVATKNVELQKTRRKGYSVVEWGGCNLDEKNNIK